VRTYTSLLVASVFAAAFSAASAAADIRHVANNGVDGPGCGTSTQPCRSISRGIQNAREGDTILVGPGLYGDINRDKDFSDPGDEAAEPTGPGHCVLCIRKRVRVISTNGADATRIESLTALFDNVESELQALVRISVAGVTFGTPGHGFELAGLPWTLLSAASNGGTLNVAGNVARRIEPHDRDLEMLPEIGIFIGVNGGSATVTGNTVIGNQFGMFVTAGGAATLTGNSAINNSWEGISTVGEGRVRLVGNFASGNGGGRPAGELDGSVRVPLSTGFNVEGADTRLEDNIAIANYGPGFRFVNSSTAKGVVLLAQHNAATGNQGPGVLVGAGGRVDVRVNNIFGNLGAGTGCGFINESGRVIDATQNFWGAATGPGPDPADKAGAGSGCDTGSGSSTATKPFATQEVPVSP
jgi:parallel beta-helix repeat protein